MKKPAKKAAKRPLARKVEAAHRTREGLQKKKRTPPHIEDETPIANPTTEDMFAERIGTQRAAEGAPDIVMEHRAQQGWGEACAKQAEPTRPPYLESMEKAIYGMGEELRQIRRSVVPDQYRQAYGPEGNCGDMVAVILAYRSQDEIEMFVYERTMKAWPGVNAGMRRMNAGNVIRGLVNRQDVETMAWLLQTQPR